MEIMYAKPTHKQDLQDLHLLLSERLTVVSSAL